MYETLRIVAKLKPRVVIWENVKNILSDKHIHNFNAYLTTMHELGYTNYHKVLNAKNYGIPQNRERVFTVSIMGNHQFEFPKGFELTKQLKDLLENNVDEKYYYSDEETNKLIELSANTKRNLSGIIQLANIRPTKNRENPNHGRVYDPDGISPTLNCCGGGNQQPIVYVKEATKKGYDIAKIGDSINLAHPNSTTRRGRVGHGVAQTILTNPEQYVIEPIVFEKRYDEGIRLYSDNTCGTLRSNSDACGSKSILETTGRLRKIIPLEAWRLMGFDDSDFYKAAEYNSDRQLYKQAGNSIVVNVLCEIINNLKEVFEMEKKEETKLIVFETDQFFDIAKFKENEPDVFNDLVKDYPCEKATYEFKVK